MATIDITVRGAGIFGLACAWRLVQRGADVQVVDPHGPGAGSSGGIVGALAPHTPDRWNAKKAFQFHSLIAAATFWQEVQAAGGVDPGYARLGRLQPIADAAGLDLARARCADAAENWGTHAQWEVCPAPKDWAPPSATGFVIHDTLSARINPARACAALVAALDRHGVRVVREASDQGLVLWATGVSGLETLCATLRKPVGNGVKGQAALFALDRRDAPQLFADGLHIVPHADGTTAVGSTSEREYTDATQTDMLLDEVMERAKAACPALADAPLLARWAGVRPRARSRAPMLGAWPDRTGHFIANGGFKIGFGMAVGIADVMADLLLDGLDCIPEGFRVEDSL